MSMNVDPVSGNSIPPGATAKEVRDDVPIMASENEYVIPANVVRYIGLDRIEKLINQAKKGLAELEAGGRIGGQKDDDLPFSPEELQASEEQVPSGPPQMAEGGLVADSQWQVDPNTGMPRWLLSMQGGRTTPTTPVAPVAPPTEPVDPNPVTEPVDPNPVKRPQESSRDKELTNTPLTGLAKSVNDWTVDDFTKYSTSRDSVGQRVGQGLVSATVPFGGLLARSRERYIERAAPQKIEGMLKSGKDLQGNPLSAEYRSQLEQVQKNLSDNPLSLRDFGFIGGAKQALKETGLVKPRETSSKTSREPYSGGFFSDVKDFVSGAGRKERNSSSKGDGLGTKKPSSTPPKESSRDKKETSSTPPKESSRDKKETSRKSGTGSGSVSMSNNKSSSSKGGKKK